MKMPVIIIFLLFYAGASSASITPVKDLQGLLADKKYSLAIKTGERLLLQYPQWPDVRFLTAYAYQMNQQPQKAAVIYQSLISSHPELPEPRNNLAIIYQARGDHDMASQLLVEAMQTHKSYAMAYQNLSRLYTGIAGEAYRRALSESGKASPYKIELTALNRIERIASPPAAVMTTVAKPVEPISPSLTDVRSTLKVQIKAWAQAWSRQDFDAYISFYATTYRADFKTHAAWVNHRRQRVMQPEFITVGLSDIEIRLQDNALATVQFTQRFDSPDYSDQVIKKLRFQIIATQWKIIEESVLAEL